MASANVRALRVAAVWGDTVLGSALLLPGQAFDWQRCLGLSPPEHVPAAPVRTAGPAWEVDARGAVEGYLRLQGREEDVARWAETGRTAQLQLGDVALLQYGPFAFFAQPIAALPKLAKAAAREPWMWLAVVLSATAHLGLGYAIATLSTPLPVPEPLELLSDRTLRDTLGFRDVLDEDRDRRVAGADGSTGEREVESVGGGGSATTRAGAGRDARRPPRVRASTAGAPVVGTGSLSDVIGSGAGAALVDTLASMRSGSSITSGLKAKDLQWGGVVGPSFKGSSSSSTGDGVPFRLGGFATGTSLPSSVPSGGRTARLGAPAASSPGPERRVSVVSSGGSSRGFSAEEIRRVVTSHMGQVRACYESALENAPGLRGSLTVSWHIDGGGAVTRAIVASSSLANGRAEGCITRVVRSWRFRNPEAVEAEASWGFAFTPSG